MPYCVASQKHLSEKSQTVDSPAAPPVTDAAAPSPASPVPTAAPTAVPTSAATPPKTPEVSSVGLRKVTPSWLDMPLLRVRQRQAKAQQTTPPLPQSTAPVDGGADGPASAEATDGTARDTAGAAESATPAITTAAAESTPTTGAASVSTATLPEPPNQTGGGESTAGVQRSHKRRPSTPPAPRGDTNASASREVVADDIIAIESARPLTRAQMRELRSGGFGDGGDTHRTPAAAAAAPRPYYGESDSSASIPDDSDSDGDYRGGRGKAHVRRAARDGDDAKPQERIPVAVAVGRLPELFRRIKEAMTPAEMMRFDSWRTQNLLMAAIVDVSRFAQHGIASYFLLSWICF